MPFRLPGEYVAATNPLDKRDYTFQADKIVTTNLYYLPTQLDGEKMVR